MDLDSQHPQAAERFAQLALELHAAHDLADTAQAIADFALHAVGCRYAGIALAACGGRFEIVAGTDPVVEAIYQAQADSGEGPMLTVLAGRSSVAVHDVTTETRWPGWRKNAVELGIGSALHVPMVTHNRTIGALSLYHTKPHAFGDDDEGVASILAQHACVAIATARQDQTMTQAIDARKLVGQATGILMERFDVDGDRAFAILKRYSQHTNTKLRDIAQHLIDTRRLPRNP